MPAWSSSWQLPDQIADVLPSEARHIEELRRMLLDAARGYGYELVMPPLLEHLESLLTGTGEALGLQTFKLVDQLSGRTLGLRADSTPQVARIDAHLLNRQSVTRLCYCGPVLHTRADRPHATREPLQFGAEIFGHAGLEADLEVQCLAIEALRAAGFGPLQLDMADVRIVNALLAGATLSSAALGRIHAALASKDAAELAALLRAQAGLPLGPSSARAALVAATDALHAERARFAAAAPLRAAAAAAASLETAFASRRLGPARAGGATRRENT
jgi:ATP phosphoribosyltransferase regulatory subunit